MKSDLEKLQKEVEAIKARNARVEADKDWETSKTRTFFICLITFGLVYGFSLLTGQSQAPLNSLIAVAAYWISTESYSVLKNWWLKRRKT